MNISHFYNARIGARAGQAGFRHKFIVAEGQTGLLYRHGIPPTLAMASTRAKFKENRRA